MEILINWGINAKKIRNDIVVEGSPQRSLKRDVYEDKQGDFYVLESISNIEKKTKIAENVQYIHEKGLAVNPYLRLRTKERGFILSKGQRNYQVSKYIEGIKLQRPDYLKERWRGEAMADFLIQLRKIQPPNKIKGPQLKEYIEKIAKEMNLEEFSFYLREFFATELDKCFCHGDFHPLNIIWGENKINSVIDWEFSGLNYRAYDICNLLGCVGSEGPWFFDSEFVKGLLNRLSPTYLTKNEFDEIPYLMLAIRFGWLSEWVRNQDEEMIELEIAYMSFIKENRSFLLNKFKNYNRS